MARTFILIDTSNTFSRARHVTRGDVSTKIGMSLHTLMLSVRKAWNDFNGDHVVFCLEGHSWRKGFYAPYKRNRQIAKDAKKPHELEEDAAFWEAYGDFTNFIKEKSNCTVLQHGSLEADDLIAGWVQLHPDDNHIIISTDGDFAQLISPNVKIYNGVTKVLSTHEGYFDELGKPVKESATGKVKPAPDPEWLLFEKCIRGDTSDNVFSAYPGVRTNGTKNKVGMREAFEDRHNQGWAWNNFLLQKWLDHEGVEHRVLDDYNRNVTLCDLTAQPDEIKQIINDTILTEISKEKSVPQVGIKLMKFCGSYSLAEITKQIDTVVQPFNSKYKRDQ